MKYTHTETRKVGKVGDRPSIDSIVLKWEQDDDMEPTFLEDEGEEYRAENEKRLDAYHSGEWSYQGCRAEAIVSYPVNDTGDRRMERFSSGGLWGIASDDTGEYRQEVEKDELTDLKAHLETFGVDTSDFWQVADKARGA
jgi:hypothetical protein